MLANPWWYRLFHSLWLNKFKLAARGFSQQQIKRNSTLELNAKFLIFSLAVVVSAAWRTLVSLKKVLLPLMCFWYSTPAQTTGICLLAAGIWAQVYVYADFHLHGKNHYICFHWGYKIVTWGIEWHSAVFNDDSMFCLHPTGDCVWNIGFNSNILQKISDRFNP